MHIKSIENMDSRARIGYFIELQRFIANNITDDDRKKYQEEVQSFDRNDIVGKIRYAERWFSIAKINKKLKWIRENFPKKIEQIEHNLNLETESRKEYYIEQEYKELKRTKKKSNQIKLNKLKNKLYQEVDYNEYLNILDKIEVIDNIELKIKKIEEILV